MFHPLQLITSFFTNLFTILIIGFDIYFLREWYYYKDNLQDENYAKWCLALAALSLLLTFLGKPIVVLFLGKKGADEPTMERSPETKVLNRPGGDQIFLEFYGKAENQPIIFIHGWGSSSLQWYYLKKYLAGKYRLILMDLPGLGESSKKSNNEYSPDSFALDLEAIITETCTQKPIIVGHSIGGMTILSYCKLFASTLADKVAGLVLVQTTYTNPLKTSLMASLFTALEKPLFRPLCYLMIAFAPLVQFNNWLKFINGSTLLENHFTGFAGTETRGQLSTISLLATMAPVDVLARGMLGMFEYEAGEILPQINIPVLILAGDTDIVCKPEASQFMHAQIPNSRLEILSPSGHIGVFERHTEMSVAVENFAQSLV